MTLEVFENLIGKWERLAAELKDETEAMRPQVGPKYEVKRTERLMVLACIADLRAAINKTEGMKQNLRMKAVCEAAETFCRTLNAWDMQGNPPRGTDEEGAEFK
jgi:hypothetical protein